MSEIKKINRELGSFRILTGMEVDIKESSLRDGLGDWDILFLGGGQDKEQRLVAARVRQEMEKVGFDEVRVDPMGITSPSWRNRRSVAWAL